MGAAATSAGRTASDGGESPRRSRSRHGGGRSAAEHVGVHLLDTLAAALLPAFLACVALLVGRRLSGAFAPPPRSIAPLVAALAGAGVVVVVDVASAARWRPALAAGGWRRGAGRDARRAWRLWAVRLGLALAVVTLLPPPTALSDLRASSIALVAIALASAAIVVPLVNAADVMPRPPGRRRRRSSAGRLRGGRGGGRRDPRAADTAPSAATVAVGPVLPSPPAAGFPLVAAPPPPAPSPPAAEGRLQQRFERVALVDEGLEVVRGTIHLSVVAGTRSATGHVGFCPPFHAVPHVVVGTTCEAIEAVIVAAEVLPWGVRVECRLDETADETIDVPVDVVASVPLAGSAPPSQLPQRD